MKIIGNNYFLATKSYTNNIKDKSTVKTASVKALRVADNEDKVILSAKAQELRDMTKVLDKVPDIREEKVAEIKSSIENGTYTIDGKKIAFKMIEESLVNELL